MFIEVRRRGKKSKYYLVHTYRVGNKVKRISRYLGSNLSKEELEKLRGGAEKLIIRQIKDRHPFELSDEEIKEYKKYEEKIEISHLHKKLDWQQFTKDFTYNTNAIEGSTVEYSKAKSLIDKKDKPKDLDEIETVNVANAIKYVRDTKGELSLSLIKKIHSLCFNKTKPFAGNFRNVDVVIKDQDGNIIHRGAPANKVEGLLKELISWYNIYKDKYPPLLLASVVHNQFEHIHPFQDGNGRVGRLLLNYTLLKNNYPPVNIRFKDRSRYYKALRKFDKNGNVRAMVKFLISQYRKL